MDVKRISALLVVVIAMLSATKVNAGFPNESLNYQIVYHWGLIWKHAGSANLTLKTVGGDYHSMLSARTISWADRIFKVRDTLSCVIRKDGLLPLRYVKAAHEGKSVVRDVVDYSYAGNVVSARCSHHRAGRNPVLTDFKSAGKAFDMLSIFYYIRTLPFPTMNKNTVYTTVVFSGRRKETLNIRYVGEELIKLRDKSSHKAFHIKFSFTQDGQKKSSDDLDTWISTSSQRIPLMMRGKLPIGEVRCYYVR